ncbi:hypothetical protein MAR_036993 [Mya arenaria]|uniref:Uncharacterized protein n=1 Tax=Mya arenaria TaxID=6604 RepID=A0ABY7FPS2_MYAAR|nr:hypothetical protein MAR_036993 [Mya arenaria]
MSLSFEMVCDTSFRIQNVVVMWTGSLHDPDVPAIFSLPFFRERFLKKTPVGSTFYMNNLRICLYIHSQLCSFLERFVHTWKFWLSPNDPNGCSQRRGWHHLTK